MYDKEDMVGNDEYGTWTPERLDKEYRKLKKQYNTMFHDLYKNCMELSQLKIDNNKQKHKIKLAIKTLNKAFDQKFCWKQDVSATINLLEEE